MCRVRWVRHRAGLGPPVPVSGRAVRLRWAGLQPAVARCPGRARVRWAVQSRAGHTEALGVSRQPVKWWTHAETVTQCPLTRPSPARYKQEKLGHFNIELRQLVIKAVWGPRLPAGVRHSGLSPVHVCVRVLSRVCVVCLCVWPAQAWAGSPPPSISFNSLSLSPRRGRAGGRGGEKLLRAERVQI